MAEQSQTGSLLGDETTENEVVEHPLVLAAIDSFDDLDEPNYDHLDLSFDDLEDFGSFHENDNNNTITRQDGDTSVVKEVIAQGGGTTYDDVDDDLGKKKEDVWQFPSDYILGTLIVRVVAARDLASVESRGGFGEMFFGGASSLRNVGRRHKGAANPYASVRFGSTTQRTTQVYGTVDPTWPRGEAMYMDVTHPVHEMSHDQFEEPHSIPDNTNIATAPVSRAKSLSSSLSIVGRHDSKDDRKEGKSFARPDPPILTVAIFHAVADVGKNQKFPIKGPGSGDSDDVFLGMIAVDLTPLLTGKLSVYDEWLLLTGSNSARASVRIVCEYEASDSAPSRGDSVRFTGFCDPEDLYPAHVNKLYTVEDSDGDQVLIACTNTEGWVSTFSVHRYMLICEERHQRVMDFYQEELASVTQRLAHSPIIDVVQDTIRRVPDEGILNVGVTAIQSGASLFSRWLEGGLGTAIGDLTVATNWDGRFNPTADDSLTVSSGEPVRETMQNGTLAPLSSIIEPEKSTNADPLPNMPSCPITREPMRDPVVAADGHTYERTAIVRWLATSDKSPLTGSVLPHKNLVPNYMLLSSLQEAVAAAKAAESPSKRRSHVIVETVSEEEEEDESDSG